MLRDCAHVDHALRDCVLRVWRPKGHTPRMRVLRDRAAMNHAP